MPISHKKFVKALEIVRNIMSRLNLSAELYS